MLFPAPRRPTYLQRSGGDVDSLTEAAKAALKRTTGRCALGQVTEADTVLIVVPPDQDVSVLSAIMDAFREAGINADAVGEVDLGIRSPQTGITPTHGWQEVMWRKEITRMLDPAIAAQDPQLEYDWSRLQPHLEEHPQFTKVYAGATGRPQIRDAMGEHGHKFESNWNYANRDQLLSRANVFPSDVLELIEQSALESLDQVDQVRISDPQGTSLFFEVSEEEAKIWAAGAFLTGHLFMYPLSPGRVLADLGKVAFEDEHLAFPKAQGVIAGTANHMGFYPHMIGHVEDGVVTRIEGGGRFGDLLREIMSRTKDVHFPRHPRPGLYYLNELGMGTNPKAFRNRSHLFDNTLSWPNHEETGRSGVLHWGMGVHSRHPEVTEFARAHDLPYEHMWHFHTYFSTFQIRKRFTQEWETLIDRGRLTVLDRADIRSLAATYGDPDEVLGEDWIPAIPGINYPGNYLDDYGNDPEAWVQKELDGRLPSTVGVPEPR